MEIGNPPRPLRGRGGFKIDGIVWKSDSVIPRKTFTEVCFKIDGIVWKWFTWGSWTVVFVL